MASTKAVWGIDIGQCALKALRLRPHDDPSRVIADAFDFIEYPKILSQPEADPAATAEATPAEEDPRPVVRFAAPFENPGDKPLLAVVLIDAGASDLDRDALAALPFISPSASR